MSFIEHRSNRAWGKDLAENLKKNLMGEEEKERINYTSKSFFEKLIGNTFGLLLVIWLFFIFVGNYESIFTLLDGTQSLYVSECLERSYDVHGGVCEVYGEGHRTTVKDKFIDSLWIASFITLFIGSLKIVYEFISKIIYVYRR